MDRRREFRAAWAKMNDAPFDEVSAGDRAGLFLIAAAATGTVNHQRLAKEAGMPRHEAKAFALRAHDQGIFVRRKIAGADWFKENGGIAFIMDAVCLAGLIERAASPHSPLQDREPDNG